MSAAAAATPRPRGRRVRARPVHVVLGVRHPVLRRRRRSRTRERLIVRVARASTASAASTCASGSEVVAIDLAARELTVRDHEDGASATEPFDQLVVATGAEAVAPPIPGADAIEPARTVDAAERLRRGARARRRAARSSSARATSASRWPRRSSSAGSSVTMIDRAAAGHARARPRHGRARAGGRRGRWASTSRLERVDRGDRHRRRRRARRGAHRRTSTFPADHVVLGDRRQARRSTIAERGRPARSATAARCASTTTSAAPATTASSRPATASRRWHRLLEPPRQHPARHARQQAGPDRRHRTRPAATPRFPGVIGTAVSKICSCEVARTGLTEREARGRRHRRRRPRRSRTDDARGLLPGRRPDLGQARRRARAAAACSAGRSSASRAPPSASTCSPTAIWAG